jgi:hypothetical protein
VARREAAQERSLEVELRRLERYGVLGVDEVGSLPLEREAANLLFALVARRYERGSIIVTPNRGFDQRSHLPVPVGTQTRWLLRADAARVPIRRGGSSGCARNGLRASSAVSPTTLRLTGP